MTQFRHALFRTGRKRSSFDYPAAGSLEGVSPRFTFERTTAAMPVMMHIIAESTPATSERAITERTQAGRLPGKERQVTKRHTAQVITQQLQMKPDTAANHMG
jgi:hypothetical protein